MSDDEQQTTTQSQGDASWEGQPRRNSETEREEQQKEEPKKEEPKKEEQKKEEPKKEPPKRQEPKKEEKPAAKPAQEETPRGISTAGGTSKKASESIQDKSESSDGRLKQKEFFKEELKRLRTSLKRESSKIHPPNKREYTPFVFNTLEPYYNTHTTKFLIEMPEYSDQIVRFASRNTAQGLIDPWVDLRMDQEILPLIPSTSRPATREPNKTRGSTRPKAKKAGGEKDQPSRKEGSTRLPKFPVVTLETKELATKQLFYSDVPMLRKELKNKYSSQARTKVDADYRRTQQDFYRMDLDRFDQVAPGSRPHLKNTYMAYLQNTPGSRRAVSECVRTLEGKAN